MGTSVLVLGHSGSGKSTSLRNFEPGTVGVFSCASKPLPFRRKLDMVPTKSYGTITQALQRNARKCFVIDDANYLMQFENFAKAKDNGYGKFIDMALHFEQLLEAANGTDEDTTVYFLMHFDRQDDGYIKPKTIGRMLDEKLCVEGMFPIVIQAVRDEGGYAFLVQGEVNSPIKAPMGMFEQPRIDNDLAAVDTIIREYNGCKPLTIEKEG